LNELGAGKPIHIEFAHSDGTKDVIKTNQTYNKQQIDWFRAGSALNLIKLQQVGN